MGTGCEYTCSSCGYVLEITEGIGMLHSPEHVFHGYDGKPFLLSLIKSERIRKKVSGLLAAGAQPAALEYPEKEYSENLDDPGVSKYAQPHDYGYEVYACPKCNRVSNLYYFKLTTPDGDYEPDYKCSKCKTMLQHAELKDHCTDDGRFIEIRFEDGHKAGWKCPKCSCDKIEKGGTIMILWD